MDNAVPLEAIPTWGTTFPSEDGEQCVDDGLVMRRRGEVTLSRGQGVQRQDQAVERDPLKIAVDAVVNSTSETFECEVFRGETIHSSGTQPGEGLPANQVLQNEPGTYTRRLDIPVVKKIRCPWARYTARSTPQRRTPSATAIWSSLEVLVEEGLRTIALGCIYTRQRVPETGAHITPDDQEVPRKAREHRGRYRLVHPRGERLGLLRAGPALVLSQDEAGGTQGDKPDPREYRERKGRVADEPQGHQDLGDPRCGGWQDR